MTSEVLAADLEILGKYFDCVRIVDPLSTAVRESNFSKSRYYPSCYHFGNSGQTCKNCISINAIQFNQTYIKTEMLGGDSFMITALPLEIDGHIVALELVKCINDATIETCHSITDNTSTMCHSLAKLNDLAIRDALTGIYNRRYIDEQMPIEIMKARQYNLPFSIVMADIDWFKQVNDQYGHLVGDEVLKFFALQLQQNIRQHTGDWVARYGGEEFLIFLINCTENQAYKVTEKLRKIIEDCSFATTVGNLHITASFGVHTFSGRESTLRQLVNKIDKNLYYAKQTGRNRTVTCKMRKGVDSDIYRHS